MKFCKHIFFSLLSIFFLILLSYPIKACTIPVYEYALEHWSADPYEILIFHRGKLSAEDQAKVDMMQKAPYDEKLGTNITIKTFDLNNSSDPAIQKLWESQQKSELPLMVVRYPRFSKVYENAWSGGLRSFDIDNILRSPARKEIARRIIGGDVAVWVFLEIGDIKEDKIKLKLLQTELKKMSDTLKIVAPGDFGQPTETDKKVNFSVIKISRNDPREKFFIQMLLNSEPDLKTLAKPMAFPVFSRGRALYALVGDGINAGNIELASSFLVGWCSCEIKELNPGVDLLISVDWDRALYNPSLLYEEEKVSGSIATVSENIDKPRIGTQKEEKPEIDRKTAKTVDNLDKEIPRITANSNTIIATPKVNSGSGNLFRNILITVLAIFVGVVSVASFMLWKRKQRLD